MIGFPSISEYKKIISNNILKEFPVTIYAINNAENIFGPDLYSIQGKTIRKNPKKVIVDFYELPEEIIKKYRNLILSTDIFFVNKMPMILTRDDKIKLLTVVFIEKRSKNTRINLILKVINMYKRKCFTPKILKADNEFKDLTEDLAKPEKDVDTNISSRNEHVGDIKRPIQTIKELWRAHNARIP